MRRRILIALLALGTVGGFASGFMHMRHCNRERGSAFEQHVAKVCVEAARSDGQPAQRANAAAPTPAQAPVEP